MKKELKIFDRPQNVKKFLGAFYISLVVLLIVDFFVHKHAEFPWEGAVEPWVRCGKVPWYDAVWGMGSAIGANCDPMLLHDQVNVLISLVEVDKAEATLQLASSKLQRVGLEEVEHDILASLPTHLSHISYRLPHQR